ncbi:unnamed protein product [Clavelina lepadiformis]|uniref:HAT C-terminal dimerisation domain-containing protein n=1 Tax=Clavelina lepadiformis TaxID=159417 RepID=A0ABP0FGI4_CLALP
MCRYTDVLIYSKSENRFPHLKAAALELLSMTATLPSSERVFSHAEELYSGVKNFAILLLMIMNSGPSPVSPPDCYQLHHSTSACGQRKAWVCDYVQWKYQIITDWLPRFLAYIENNGIYARNLPDCPADYPDMCTNYDQRRCAERLGCRACFCADNLYKGE